MSQIDFFESVTDKRWVIGKRLLTVIAFMSVSGCFDHIKYNKNEASPDSSERSWDDAGVGSLVENQASAAVDEAGGGIGSNGAITGSGRRVLPEDAGIGSLASSDVCNGIKLILPPVEIEESVEVPYEISELVPAAIYFMIDRSTNMNDVSGSATKWATMVDAIYDFVNNSNSAFLDVGLQYFPLDSPSCDGTGYDTPAVPIGDLPENAGNISDFLVNTQLEDFVPLEPALRGMTAFCAAFQNKNPEEPCAGIVISGGEPTQCALDTNALSDISRNAYDNSNVKTFTVGMAGADVDLLDQIASGGGTDCTPDNTSDGYACDVSSGMTLTEAFENIRKTMTRIEVRTETRVEIVLKISHCEWNIPEMPEGVVFESDLVNLVFSKPGEPEITIGKIPTGRRCDHYSSRGWFYDDEDLPTKIIACDQTCDDIKYEVISGSADMYYGCETVLIE